jgi:hypothetical protein
MTMINYKTPILESFETLLKGIEDESTKAKLRQFQFFLELYVDSCNSAGSKQILKNWKVADILERGLRNVKSRSAQVKELKLYVKEAVVLLRK